MNELGLLFSRLSRMGKQLVIIPHHDGRFVLFESDAVMMNLSYKIDTQDFVMGDSLVYQSKICSSVKCEVDSFNAIVHVFSNVNELTEFMKVRANQFWPSCKYCFVRFGGQETKCSSCGAPRGDEDV